MLLTNNDKKNGKDDTIKKKNIRRIVTGWEYICCVTKFRLI